MTQPYLEAFRRAVREMQERKSTTYESASYEINEFNELVPEGSQLNSLNSLNSYLSILERRCPAYIDGARWQQCLTDGRRFVADWGSQALGLGWTLDNLFGLHVPPEAPHPSYSRLSRQDCTGLVWLLQGARVTALSSETAAIQMPSGNILKFRRVP
jgi:hypothetical protein